MHKLQVVIYTRARLLGATFQFLHTVLYLALGSILAPRTKYPQLDADAPQSCIFRATDARGVAEGDSPLGPLGKTTFQKLKSQSNSERPER